MSNKIVEKVKDKISDYECTKFPEGRWHHCCVQHDMDYENGVNKWKADANLAWCVAKRGHLVVAPMMWIGVTLFGWKPYKEHEEYRSGK